MTMLVAFSGGPLDGELRQIPDERPPLSMEVPTMLLDWAAHPDSVPATSVFRYVRHAHDGTTGITIYVPESEQRVTSPTPSPGQKTRVCRGCQVRWYGTPTCWMCGEETAE